MAVQIRIAHPCMNLGTSHGSLQLCSVAVSDMCPEETRAGHWWCLYHEHQSMNIVQFVGRQLRQQRAQWPVPGV